MPPSKVRTKTAGAKVVHNVWCFCHTAENPSDEEWAELMKGYTAGEQQKVRTLVYSEGGAPNAAQRAKLKQLQGGIAVPIAVMTPSAVVRMAVTAIGWFNDRVSSFNSDQIDEALTFLDIPYALRPDLVAAMSELKAEVLRSTTRPQP